MKFLLLGVALLCVSQVRGEDLLHSIFEKKVKELNLADAAPAATDPWKGTCDAQDVVDKGTTLVKNTLDILAGTFKVVYTTQYPESGRKDCEWGTFRCFLKEFNDVKGTIQTVKNNLVSYRNDAASLSSGISEYFSHCMK